MPRETQMSAADVADRHRRLMAYALVALGVMYAASAGRSLVDGGARELLGLVELGLALTTVGLMVPVFWWKARNRSTEAWHLYKGSDGFVAHTIAQAQSVSWVVVLVALVVVKPLAGRFADLPLDLYFDLLLALMVLSFAAVFLHLDRDPAEEAPDPVDA